MYSDFSATTEQRLVFTVTEINRAAKNVLENAFTLVWVTGEISNLSCPSSGHVYFSLKDETAQIRCALFRNRKFNHTAQLSNGMQVVLQARVSLYEGRGDFQLIVEYWEAAGDGQLQRAFELLKQKLAAEGLFAETHKKTLPPLPKKIGVITSPTGAAIKDVLTVLKRRFPTIPVIIYPTQVQGDAAAPQIADAIRLANTHNECDVLIVTRGGGSLEDLWPFNEEIVARAIYHSEIPIISAVGHEIDFTIADFVADVRAPTPSAAAELVSPNQLEWQMNLLNLEKRIIYLMQQNIKQKQHLLLHLQKRLRHPGDLIRERMQRIDYLEQNLTRIMLILLHKHKAMINSFYLSLLRHNPTIALKLANAQLNNLSERLPNAMQQKLQQAKINLQNKMHALNTVSPLATLERGYAIVSETHSHKILRSTKDITVGMQINARLFQGSLLCTVLEKLPADEF